MVVNELEVFDKKAVAETFNKFFSEIGPKFSFKIPHSLTSFEQFLHGDSPWKNDELNEAPQTLKAKKSSEYDDIYSDVIKHISPLVFEPMRYIFNLSIEKGIFPDQLKIAEVNAFFKNALMDNYCPISIPCFSKILERIIYNRLYSFFSENDILCKKQIGFQKQQSTNHAIVHLVNEI